MTLADDASRAQRRAADAARSVWVSASAGSGKTKVLTDRVLNLLLTGAAPDRLLCLTFTKAAAAEMSNRINERLGNWTVAAEGKLRDDIAALTGRPADADTCRTARRLFARVLDTPGGMRILTIHAFCQSILRRFPLEAEIIPNFEVMDDRSAAELQAEARNAVLVAARENPGSPLAAAFAAITASVEENGFAKLLTEIQSKRGALQSSRKRGESTPISTASGARSASNREPAAWIALLRHAPKPPLTQKRCAGPVPACFSRRARPTAPVARFWPPGWPRPRARGSTDGMSTSCSS